MQDFRLPNVPEHESSCSAYHGYVYLHALRDTVKVLQGDLNTYFCLELSRRILVLAAEVAVICGGTCDCPASRAAVVTTGCSGSMW